MNHRDLAAVVWIITAAVGWLVAIGITVGALVLWAAA